jgi:hypothetical protein
MSNKELRPYIAQLLARQRNEDQPLTERKPPKAEPPKPPAVTEKKPLAAETRKLNVRKKAK